MNDLLRTIEQRLLDAPDGVCLERARLVTEAYRTHGSEPMPVRRALALQHVLANMTLDLETNPIFAGNTSSRAGAMMLIPEAGPGLDAQVKLEHPDLDGLIEQTLPPEIAEFWADRAAGCGTGGIGHCCGDLGRVVNHGLEWVIDQIDRAEAGTQRADIYRRAMKISCRAVIDWAGRYSQLASRQAEATEDPTVAACLRRIADACSHVPARPARDLFEGLQSILLVHLAMQLEGQGMSVSLGLIDRALGRLAGEAHANPEGAANRVAGFLLAVSGNTFCGRGSKTQAITIGGADCQGRDRSNAITLAFLRAYGLVRSVSDPHVFVRWHRGLAPEVLEAAAGLLADGRSMPHLVNDHVAAAGLIDLGIEPQHAWNYAIIGCNEVGIPGRCFQTAWSAGLYHNDLQLLREVLRRDAGKLHSMRNVLDACEEAYFDLADRGIVARRKRTDELAEQLPMPLSSALFEGTVEQGDDLLRALPGPPVAGAFTRGTANAANVLCVLDRRVFTPNGEPLDQALAAVEDGERDSLAPPAPAWGRDDDGADRWLVELCEARTRAFARAARKHELAGIAVCHVVRSLHHLDGKAIGPTLDGRGAGEPVADSIGPVTGTNPLGPTAALNSVLKIDAARHFAGIYNLNLTLPFGLTTPPVVRALVEAFFADGGQELQINVLDPARLRAALADPTGHRDLVVRVAGLNARFVELSPAEQQEILRRAELAYPSRCGHAV